MKKLGVVLHTTSYGNLLVRGNLSSKKVVSKITGSVVVTKNMKRIGKVYDVLGPVKQPYISIRPFKQISESELYELSNDLVYIL